MIKFTVPTLTRLRRGLLATAGAALVLGSLAAVGQAVAHPHDMAGMSAEDGARMRQHMLERASRELALDPAQKQRLTTLFDKLAEQRKLLRGSDADPRAKARALVAGPTFDRAGAQALVDQKTGALRSAAPEVIAAFGDFYDGLKPEQQGKLRTWMDRRGGHGWMGAGLFGGPGEHGGPRHGHAMHPGALPAGDQPPPPPAARP